MKSKKQNSVNSLKFKSVVKFIIWFYIIIVIAQIVMVGAYTINSMKTESKFVNKTTSTQISLRTNNTLTLLSALTTNDFFIDPEISYIDKSIALNKYSATYDYFMMCIVDKDFNVYDENGLSANLSTREYMQKMFTTLQPQITDSIAAGSDGVTLNYTIAYPIIKTITISGNPTKVFDGCIFASISFAEIQDMLGANVYGSYQNLTLYGSQHQIMSTTTTELYGDKFVDSMQKKSIMGNTIKNLEASMYSRQNGYFWSMNGVALEYTSYSHVVGTNWVLMCTLSFWSTFAQFLPLFLGMIIISSLAAILFIFLANRYVEAQTGTMKSLINSVQDLEKKIYQNERPDNVDFKEIISLTSKGLTDELTGVITRSVFLNQIPFKIKAVKADELGAMCFVDLDDLKVINDTYGHNFGDIILKNIGYILREYEKRFDGLVGRHGGDEFTIFLSGFKTRQSLQAAIAEMTSRLQFVTVFEDEKIPTHCSVGVAVYNAADYTNSDEDVAKLIKQADKMLYHVKQHGKATYSIHGSNDKVITD